MEEQVVFERLGQDRPVQEAELTRHGCPPASRRDSEAGWKPQVFSYQRTISSPSPIRRPEDFHAQAEQEIKASARFDALPAIGTRSRVWRCCPQTRRDDLSIAASEIAARAKLLNEKIKPDLTIACTSTPLNGDDCHDLVDDNRLVVFVHGNYLAGELKGRRPEVAVARKTSAALRIQRNLATAEAIATTLATAAKLPLRWSTDQTAGSIRTVRQPVRLCPETSRPIGWLNWPRCLSRTVLPEQSPRSINASRWVTMRPARP